MAKNLMPEVAKLLGVEMGEEFKFKGFNRFGIITEEGLLCRQCGGTDWDASDSDLTDLLIGCKEIEMPPWKPKEHEKFYYVAWFKGKNTWMIGVEKSEYLAAFDADTLRVDIGNCFKTKEEAEAAKFDVFERLTGKKWEEVFGKAGEAE